MKSAMPRNDLNLLRVLVLLAETRSVSKASKVLGVTQPAVSQALRKLRDSFGDPLFILDRKGLIVTEKAASLIPEIKALLEQLEGVLVGNRSFDSTSSTRAFRIGMLDLTEHWLLPALIEITLTEAPGIRLMGFALPDAQDISGMLESGQLDLVLTSYEPTGKNVRSQRVSEEQFATMARPRQDGSADALTLDEFVNTPHVVFQERSASIDDALEAIGKRRMIGAVAQNFLSMPAIAAKSGFICSLPQRSAAICAKSHNLNVHAPPVNLTPWPLFVGWHSKFNVDPSIRWLIEKVKHVALNT